MQRPDELLHSRAHQNGVKPLPLFRPEALLHQRQKSLGEIILIRPVSLTLLTSLVIAIVALALGFLLLGGYTEKVRLSGSLLPGPHDVTGSNPGAPQAELYVPASRLAQVRPGMTVLVRCPTCSSPIAETGAVLRVEQAPSVLPGRGPAGVLQPMYKITVSLPAAQVAELNQPSPSGMPIEAEIPLGRKPFIRWLFQRSGS
jgi:hypothetical protein